LALAVLLALEPKETKKEMKEKTLSPTPLGSHDITW
jgi:hypothetical protein